MIINLNTKFTGKHRNTTLISLAIVLECGKTFYAEFIDYDKKQVNKIIKEKYINNCFLIKKYGNKPKIININNKFIYKTTYCIGNKEFIKEKLLKFLKPIKTFKNKYIISDCFYSKMLFDDLLKTETKYIDLRTMFCNAGFFYDLNQEDFLKAKFYHKHLQYFNKDTFKIFNPENLNINNSFYAVWVNGKVFLKLLFILKKTTKAMCLIED